MALPACLVVEPYARGDALPADGAAADQARTAAARLVATLEHHGLALVQAHRALKERTRRSIVAFILEVSEWGHGVAPFMMATRVHGGVSMATHVSLWQHTW